MRCRYQQWWQLTGVARRRCRQLGGGGGEESCIDVLRTDRSGGSSPCVASVDSGGSSSQSIAGIDGVDGGGSNSWAACEGSECCTDCRCLDCRRLTAPAAPPTPTAVAAAHRVLVVSPVAAAHRSSSPTVPTAGQRRRELHRSAASECSTDGRHLGCRRVTAPAAPLTPTAVAAAHRALPISTVVADHHRALLVSTVSIVAAATAGRRVNRQSAALTATVWTATD